MGYKPLTGRVFLPVVVLALVFAFVAFAQAPMPTPQASPEASVSQAVGISTVTVTYHRPGVKGRVIWGKLVPYGAIWRAGANENTTVTFSDPVKVEGKELPAGTYGLHMIPSEGDWTIVFSKNHTSWGDYFYNQSEDALRVTVKPQPAEMQEWMAFEFSDLTNTSAVLSLHWEKLRVPVAIAFDTDGIVLANARNSYLRGQAGFSWQSFNQAANYCLRRGINLDEALAWADKSISMNENLTNLSTKAGLLDKQGKTAEAKAVRDRAAKVAVTEQDVNQLGYLYLNANMVNEAIDVFKKNVKAHPDSWNAHDSLAEGYLKAGDKKMALESFKKSLGLVKDDENKQRIEGEIQKLEGK